MNAVEEYLTTINGLSVHMIETEKYKTNTLVLQVKSPLRKETVTQRAILPYVLQSATVKSPSRKEIRSRLEDLYGATLTVDVGKKGENQIISIRMDIANEKFLADQTPLLEEALHLLAEVLLQPKTENDGFVADIIEKEKRALKQRIQSIYDDKMRYANMRITEEMCKDEPYGLSVYGAEEDVEQISAKELYQYYTNVLQEDEIDLYVVGDVKRADLEKKIAEIFSLPADRQVKKQTKETDQKEIQKENVVHEEQDIQQGKLHIGYRTYTTYASDDYYALQVFNGLFGGFSHSKLFINVREKASLAYYAASRFESHKGILMVMSGIEFANYDQAVSIIKEQMGKMQSGDFTDEEIEQTKAMIKNQVLETMDGAKGLVELLYHNVVAGFNRPIEEWLRGIDEVTREDIVTMANKVKLDTIYFLKGKEEK
ncbi:EF-P 5-aminopentanol modification-associated protein YfmF [Anaerobacillus sp. MEB173]|uniref:EF-P 5-aminopentanol modification-associated protein YfmF n=1 Tax=Anaerobacillus sp. MEB173 TaxID=3383345 RepID=UPI003F936A76